MLLKRRELSFLRCEISKVSSAEGGPMARSGPLLTEVQWKKIAPLLPSHANTARVAARGSRTVAYWKAFCGFCGAVPAGRTYRRNIRILRPAGGGCGIGRSGTFG